MKLSSHIIGESCNCIRLKCFKVISLQDRQTILDKFNQMSCKDQQDAFLTSIVTPMEARQKRPRIRSEDLHCYSYQYHLLIARDSYVKIQICYKAFLSIFNISKSRLERIQKVLTTTGISPKDQRGKHMNCPRNFTKDKNERIINHIRSFRGQQSHYSLKDSKKVYLPEDLNLSRMHAMYLESLQGKTCSRESYRCMFNKKFNIAFGYTRKDTCSTCDRFKIDLSNSHPKHELEKLLAEGELHWKKGKLFYERKTVAVHSAHSLTWFAAIAFDYWKNLPCPNITTNDTYYKRKLSLYTFNIHNLGANKVYLFSYDETIGKKGLNDVASMLLHYFIEILSKVVTHLQLFCNSCPGQNKNWTMLRFLHYMVHQKKRFENIKLSFPIRGHSYMECDRDIIVINQKIHIDTPADWCRYFEDARKSPSPFYIISVENTMLLNIEKHIKTLYFTSFPIQTQTLQEIVISKTHPDKIIYRDSWNEPFLEATVTKPIKKKRIFLEPLQPLNRVLIPISLAKYKDLQHLKLFCKLDAREFYDYLPYEKDGQSSPVNDYSDFDEDEEIEL
ncbi:uncharacterized protein LOC136091418 [Hydra vulgaris]|uniref:Uncharacterized protein LOC136091418 n=1 Tax=Hydra vulgaris TaxID=6087 RepID=A0ABM4DKK2_HYDVU